MFFTVFLFRCISTFVQIFGHFFLFLRRDLQWTVPNPHYCRFAENTVLKVPEGTREKYIAAGWDICNPIEEYQLSSVSITAKQEIAIYPTLATDHVVVANANGCKLTVVDAQGYIIYQNELINEKETLHVTNWLNGVYYFATNQPNSSKMIKKIIKK